MNEEIMSVTREACCLQIGNCKRLFFRKIYPSGDGKIENAAKFNRAKPIPKGRLIRLQI